MTGARVSLDGPRLGPVPGTEGLDAHQLRALSRVVEHRLNKATSIVPAHRQITPHLRSPLRRLKVQREATQALEKHRHLGLTNPALGVERVELEHGLLVLSQERESAQAPQSQTW